MTERNYWVLCDDNCRFPAMTKEQIYDAIAEATGMTPTPVDEAFITMIKEQNANHNMKFWHGTEAQFNALEETDPDTVYVIGTNKVKSVDALEEAISELQEEVQPVERGGTGATTAAQARTNLGLHGAETRTLLWTNASPSSAFATQTLTLDLSGYDEVEVIGIRYTDNAQCESFRMPIGKKGIISFIYGNSGSMTGYYRPFEANSDGVKFSGGYATTSNSDAGNNACCIPYKIYGIKGV